MLAIRNGRAISLTNIILYTLNRTQIALTEYLLELPPNLASPSDDLPALTNQLRDLHENHRLLLSRIPVEAWEAWRSMTEDRREAHITGVRDLIAVAGPWPIDEAPSTTDVQPL